MEQAIIPTNQRKFHQSKDSCPFLKEPLVHHFGFHGEKEGYDQFLKNEYNIPDSIDKTTRRYIDTCQKNAPPKINIMSRSPTDFAESWKKMKEKTSSRRLHFGHFKACCQEEPLLGVNYIMAEVPFQSGYSPSCWKNATDVMILKKAGLYDVDKLCTIVLYEADFNHNNKWLGKSMMDKACDLDKIAVEQYSIPGKKSINHALNRRLVFDITWYQKSSLAMTSCDLKSCYDRIVHVPAMMAMHRAGASVYPSKSMFSTIQQTQHVTRTAFGDSKETYGGVENFLAPVMGVGQGNGCGPQVWAVASSVMFEILKEKRLTTKFVSPISRQQLKLCRFAFVDDTDLLQSAGSHQNINDPDFTMEKMQESINVWESAAKTTGGSIAVDKRVFYLIHFTWDKGKWSYGDMENVLNDELNCKDKDGQRCHLNYIPAHKAKEMLGVFLAPDGNNAQQVKEMTKKTKYFGEMIRTRHLDRNEVWTSLTSVALKSLEYPLPALTLLEDECTKIMWPLLKAYLPRAGINRHFPRDVLYGKVEKQGIGLKNLYLSQGIAHIVDIINHTWHGSLTGTLISQSLEQLRLETGINGNLFAMDYNKYKGCILTESWIQHTWKFASDFGIEINPIIPELELRREGDCCIMEKVVQSKLLSANKLKWFNRCQLYLKVVTVADISTPDGKMLRKDCLDGVPTRSHRQLGWPNWHKPPLHAWTLWRKTLRLVFTDGLSIKLTRNLGSWWNVNFNEWEWFLSATCDMLYRCEGDSWKKFKRNTRITRTLSFHENYTLETNIDETELLPTLVEQQRRYLKALEPASFCAKNQEIQSMVDKLDPQKFKWLFAGMQSSENINKIISDLENGTAVAVSDGSFGLNNSIVTTAAWIIQSQDGSQFISGVSTPAYNEGCKGAYRGELVGLLSIIHLTTFFCKKHQIRQGQIHIGCDNQRALSTAFTWNKDKLNTNHKHSDILSAIAGLLQLKKVKISYEHIPAHQHDILPQSDLGRMAKLNIKMDTMAKAAANLVMQGELRPPRSTDHPLGFMNVAVHGRPICHLTSEKLYEFISDISIHEWWLTKNRYKVQDIPSIHWSVCAEAARATSGSKQRFASKWSLGQLGTGTKVKQWNYRPHDACPFCMQDKEDSEHILLCQHEDAIKLWHEQLQKIEESLTKWDTEVTLKVALCQDLQSWRHKERLPSLQFLPSHVRKPVIDMRSLGYARILEGLLPRSVIEFQEDYYKDSESRKSGKSWGKKVYNLFWNVLQALWAERNKQLHNTNRIYDLQGLDTLKDAIRQEYNLGLHRLPACEFSIFFSSPVETLLTRDIVSLRVWLQSIRLGRELHGGIDIIHDECSVNGAFRSWLGLGKI